MIMFPDMMGIYCPKELEHMYGDTAVSPGDGDPVVTEYPQYPMSGYELLAYLKGKAPKHCKELQDQYPNYFDAHAEKTMTNLFGKRKKIRF